MKSGLDPRHLRRVRIIKALYALNFSNAQPDSLKKDDQEFLRSIVKQLPTINQQINLYSTRFGVDKMVKIDLSILQLGVFELLYDQKAPSKVVIDEAIEIAKEFGSNKSPNLINGILAKILEANLKT